MILSLFLRFSKAKKKIFICNCKNKAYLCTAFKETGVAQSVEHWSPKPGVGSSSLSSRAKDDKRTANSLSFFCI